MTVLLEVKEKLRAFYSKNEVYLLPMIKFLLAAVIFWLIKEKIGYMDRLNSLSLLLILALICAVLPSAAMLFVTALLISLHCYALSMPAGAIIFVLFVVMYLLYFRFAPHYGYNALLVPIAYMLRVPYAIPVANGLLQQPSAMIPTICGTVTYYFLEGVIANANSLATVAEDETLLTKFREVLNQFTGNREMYLACTVFAFITLVVYMIRRMPIDYAWQIAIVTGVLLQFLIFFAGYMQFGMSNKNGTLTAGCIISALLLAVIQFFSFNLDYTRTERVQFEDDEYYYYVKAVPKQYVATRAKTVKKIHANRRDGEFREESQAQLELEDDMDNHRKDES